MSDAEDRPDTAQPAWRTRKLRQGRWTEPPAPRQRAVRTVSVKLTEAELAAFDAQVAAAGIKRNRALRIAARRIGGFLEVADATSDALRDIARQIGGVATNINQIAKAANRTHEPAYRAFMEERARLGRDLARVEGLLQQVLNIAKRRHDGLQRLQEAATAVVTPEPVASAEKAKKPASGPHSGADGPSRPRNAK